MPQNNANISISYILLKGRKFQILMNMNVNFIQLELAYNPNTPRLKKTYVREILL